MKYWITSYAPVYLLGSKSSKRILYLPEKTVVESVGYHDPALGMSCVEYDPDTKFSGWIEDKFLEPYIRNYPADVVDFEGLQTATQKDALQYVDWQGVQYNLCGEICVTMLYHVGLRQFMETWQRDALPFYKRVLGAGKFRGTGSGELIEMFNLFHGQAVELQTVIKKYTPDALARLVETGGVIASVNIDGNTGRLRGSGVGHWVVVTGVECERNGYGFVEIYNPFCNGIEVYSWAEFIASTRNTPYGAYLKTA